MWLQKLLQRTLMNSLKVFPILSQSLFFMFGKVFISFTTTLSLFFFVFFRKILIPFSCFFLVFLCFFWYYLVDKLFIIFPIYNDGKKLSKKYNKLLHHNFIQFTLFCILVVLQSYARMMINCIQLHYLHYQMFLLHQILYWNLLLWWNHHQTCFDVTLRFYFSCQIFFIVHYTLYIVLYQIFF